MEELLIYLFQLIGIQLGALKWITLSLSLIILTLGALITGYFFHILGIRIIKVLIKRSKNTLDDIIFGENFLNTLGWIVPPIVLYWAIEGTLTASAVDLEFILRLIRVFIILLSARLMDIILGNVNKAVLHNPQTRTIPVSGYLQVAKVFFYILAIIFSASELLDQDPWGIISGIGALTAVLLLVFKDSLLGLTASVQISTNNLVNMGDWIEVPAFGADGEVIDLGITQIKVKNWNNTISSIPTYALVSGTFKNWRGMVDSGARRIKRSLLIDMNTITFLGNETLQRLMTLDLLRPYLEKKSTEVLEANGALENPWNGRRLTNIGTFRAYVEAYLRSQRGIRQDITLLVRQLEPREGGLPLEIYCFSQIITWVGYEDLQSDIFDHLLAILPYFDLEVYQSPAGRDFRGSPSLGPKLSNS